MSTKSALLKRNLVDAISINQNATKNYSSIGKKLSTSFEANSFPDLKVEMVEGNASDSRRDKYISYDKENNRSKKEEKISITKALDHIQELRIFYDQNGLTNWDGLLMVENDVINLVNLLRKQQEMNDRQKMNGKQPFKGEDRIFNNTPLKRKLDVQSANGSGPRIKSRPKLNDEFKSTVSPIKEYPMDGHQRKKIAKDNTADKPNSPVKHSKNSQSIKESKIKTQANISDQDKKTVILRECKFCESSYENLSNLKNHTLNHFKDQILGELPATPPLQCPKCELKPCRDKITLLRHYSFAHEVILNYCSKEDLMGKPQEV